MTTTSVHVTFTHDSFDIEIGSQFRAARADANVLWEVTEFIADDVVRATAVNEPWEHDGVTYDSDFAGEVSVFTVDLVAGAINMQRSFERRMAEHKAWWASRCCGEILHYNTDSGIFIRGEVVVAPDGARSPIPGGSEWGGEHVLKPIAIVSDQPRPAHYTSHYFDDIDNGRVMQPRADSIFEADECRKKSIDPTSLTPLERP